MRLNPLVPFRSNAMQRSGNGPRGAFGTDLEDWFNRFFDTGAIDHLRPFADFAPSMDVSETDTHFIMKADLPGIEKENLHLELHDDLLTVKGERREETAEGEGENKRVVECSYGSFQRAIRLPFTPSEKDVETHYEKGVLTVKIAKPEDAPKTAKKIPIKGKWV